MAIERSSVPPGMTWPAWLAAAGLLVALVGTAIALSRSLQQAENLQVERYFDSIITHLETDLLGNANAQMAIQGRMAMRLALDGPFDRVAWSEDASRLIEDYTFYYLLAVLDADYRIRWLEGQSSPAVAEGDLFPLGIQALEWLENAKNAVDVEMVTIPLEPLRLRVGQPALLLMTPILVNGEVAHWLAAVMIVPESIESMLTGFYRRDVILAGHFAGQDFSISDDPVLRAMPSAFSRRIEFPLDDGQTVLHIDVGLKSEAIDQIRTALPATVLVLGSGLALLLVIAAVLAMAATRQAKVLRHSNLDLQSEIRDRELAERELASMLTHDSLTGLPNRQGVVRHLERAINDLEPGHRLAVIYTDLDQFKDINETLGHHLGDELLRQIPGRFATELEDRDIIGRLGGDEFLILVARRDLEQVQRLAARLLASLDESFRVDQHPLFVTASIGIAHLESDTASPAELIQNADAALHRAKQLGRNQYAVFTPEMFAEVEYRLNLSRDIRQALEERRFSVVYQPIVDLQTFELRGVEALLRWSREDGAAVSPRDFIRVAEETGMVHRLSQYALEIAISDLADWRRRFDDAPWLAVNISGAQFREPDFVRGLSVLLHRHRVPPHQVHLEITEEILIENLNHNRAILDQLNEIGMPIAVDDFGVGYSSLAYIKNFPISTLKIDQGFIRELDKDAEDQAITRTICNLSRDLKLQTVAEGIERDSQLELLRQYGCALGQGFLFMHPSPEDRISSVLAGDIPWAGRSGERNDRLRRPRGV